MDADTGIAVCAALIALGSFWISWAQTRSTRIHQRQSVRPLLQVRRAKSYDDSTARLDVTNAGLGPAIVTRTLFMLDGEAIGQWNLDTYRTIARALPFKPKVTTLTEGAVVLIGQKIYLLHIDDYNEEEHRWFWELISQRISIEIHYESLYGGEDFVVRSMPL